MVKPSCSYTADAGHCNRCASSKCSAAEIDAVVLFTAAAVEAATHAKEGHRSRGACGDAAIAIDADLSRAHS